MTRTFRTKPMKEMLYRESRIAKALGDPAKYIIVNLLMKSGPLSVNEIVRRVSRSQPTVSHHLARLRNLEIVRFETKGDGTYYWIKYPSELKVVISALNHFIERTLRGVNSEE